MTILQLFQHIRKSHHKVGIWLLLLGVLASTQELWAQENQPRLQIALDTNQILIGDQIHFKISAPVPKNSELILPDYKDSIVSKLEIISKTIDTTENQDGSWQITHDYLITSFDTGYIFIPPVEVTISDNGYNSSYTSDSLGMYVATPIVDLEKGIFDIKPVANLPFKLSEWEAIYYLIGISIFFIILTILVVLFFVRKRKKLPLFGQKKEVIPADILALRQLAAIKEQKLWQKEEVKAYYTGITDALRHYLDARYGMQTMESTSGEILSEIKERKEINIEDQKLLQEVLLRADMVKFAKATPLPNENDLSMQQAVVFVEHTRQILVEKESTTQEEN